MVSPFSPIKALSRKTNLGAFNGRYIDTDMAKPILADRGDFILFILDETQKPMILKTLSNRHANLSGQMVVASAAKLKLPPLWAECFLFE